MRDRSMEWFEYAEADLAAAEVLVDEHEPSAAHHAHQAAEKGLKALQIHLEGDHERTHDLVRLYHSNSDPCWKTSTRRAPRRGTPTQPTSSSTTRGRRSKR